jgi:hypothetical protein
MKSVNENRERLHLELALAVAEFELNNKVTYCKPQKTKVSRGVRAKTKLVFGTAQPKARPSNAWDVLLTA